MPDQVRKVGAGIILSQREQKKIKRKIHKIQENQVCGKNFKLNLYKTKTD